MFFRGKIKPIDRFGEKWYMLGMGTSVDKLQEIVKEIEGVAGQVSPEEVDRLVTEILNARRIYLFGLGRTLLMGRAFIMRQMHLGLHAFVVGDTTTPGIGAQDLLIVCSGSGDTDSSLLIAKKGKRHGAAVSLATANPISRIGAVADMVVRIPAPTTMGGGGAARSMQPMATLFEQCLLVVFDLVVLELMERTSRRSEDMLERHANLE